MYLVKIAANGQVLLIAAQLEEAINIVNSATASRNTNYLAARLNMARDSIRLLPLWVVTCQVKAMICHRILDGNYLVPDSILAHFALRTALLQQRGGVAWLVMSMTC